jgi:hypothetical protein
MCASAAGAVIISTFSILVIVMASLPVAIVAGEFGVAMAFGEVMDLTQDPCLRPSPFFLKTHL